VAKVICENLYNNAEREYTYNSKINIDVIEKINQIINGLDAGNIQPNWNREVNSIQRLREQSNANCEDLKVTMDLYVENFDEDIPLYIEMKSPKPNKDQCLRTKRKLLKVLFSEDWKGEHVYFGLTYNPWITREEYNHPHIKATFQIPESPKILIGEELWNFLGGINCYQTILRLAEEAGERVNVLEQERGLERFL
jgi:hypothetical protein